MLIITNKRFKKQYVVGGAGLFDTVASVLRKLFTSDAAKQLASATVKEVGRKAVDIGKTAAFDAGKKLTTKLLTSKSQGAVTQKTRDTLERLVNQGTTNINNLMMGTGTKSDPVAIQDLVRRLNGGGKKVI